MPTNLKGKYMLNKLLLVVLSTLLFGCVGKTLPVKSVAETPNITSVSTEELMSFSSAVYSPNDNSELHKKALEFEKSYKELDKEMEKWILRYAFNHPELYPELFVQKQKETKPIIKEEKSVEVVAVKETTIIYNEKITTTVKSFDATTDYTLGIKYPAH